MLVASRERFRSVDVAFEVSDRDIATGGAVLAGAVAFRMFLWTLPASLLAVGLLGFSEHAGSGATSLGLGKATAQTVETAAREAHRARWLLIVVGLIFLVSVSRTLGMTLRAAVALTWQLPLRRGSASYVRTAGATAGLACSALAVLSFCSWLRHQSVGIGIVASLLAILIWAAGWWGVSLLLPHPPLPWWGLLPGAALFGIGAELLHFLVIFYLAPRVTSASALYGSLGLASTMLLGAYILARLMIASAGLNATIHARHAPAPNEPEPGPIEAIETLEAGDGVHAPDADGLE